MADSMESLRAKMQKEIDGLNVHIIEKDSKILDLESVIISLRAELEKFIDIEKQLAEALAREVDNRAARDSLQKELENATEYIITMEEKVYKSNKISLELLKQLKDAEMEIGTL